MVAWAKQRAIPITTVEPGHGLADLQALKATIGQARVVTLGESVPTKLARVLATAGNTWLVAGLKTTHRVVTLPSAELLGVAVMRVC